MALILHLRSLGHLALGPASTGESALALARIEKPDLVLMDVNLEGPLDGVETAWAIRAFSEVAIIFMSALSADIVASRIWGFNSHNLIEKPFNLGDITRLIESLE